MSSDDALCAVKGWVNLKEALGGDFDANPASVTAYDGEDVKGKFYVVTLEGGGYVVASGGMAYLQNNVTLTGIPTGARWTSTSTARW